MCLGAYTGAAANCVYVYAQTHEYAYDFDANTGVSLPSLSMEILLGYIRVLVWRFLACAIVPAPVSYCWGLSGNEHDTRDWKQPNLEGTGTGRCSENQAVSLYHGLYDR